MDYKPQNDWKFIKPIVQYVEEEPEEEVPQEDIEAPEEDEYQQNQNADDQQNQQPQPHWTLALWYFYLD